MLERELQAAIISLARYRGYLVAHFRPALTQAGKWTTPVQGDGAGFPDLVIVGHGRLIFAELKSTTGRLSDRQRSWLQTLDHTETRAETYVWRPDDWQTGRIDRVLGGAEPETWA